ncbi:DinB family protein [Aquirufa sp. ROCK2-A2]
MDTATNSVERLRFLCDIIPDLLNQIDDNVFSDKEQNNKWSKKEILGHLIDSATNNHQRFVRAQFEPNPEIVYDQENWNLFSYYQQMDSRDLIGFWLTYNKHLISLIENMPKESLSRTCLIAGNLLTLHYLVDDYVVHLEHHLKQITSY